MNSNSNEWLVERIHRGEETLGYAFGGCRADIGVEGVSFTPVSPGELPAEYRATYDSLVSNPENRGISVFLAPRMSSYLQGAAPDSESACVC
jgi:hypothetical protein